MLNFFAYGTLLLPEVMLAVTGRSFASRMAILGGFARYRIRGQSFPGIFPEPGASVTGLVYWEIDGLALDRLDAYEDAFYHRETVAISTAAGVGWAAETYVINEESHGLLLREDWCFENFRRQYSENII